VRMENTRESRGLGDRKPTFLGGILESLSDSARGNPQKKAEPTTRMDRETRASQLEGERRVAQGIMYLQAKRIQ
jgi:hypothetical protein